MYVIFGCPSKWHRRIDPTLYFTTSACACMQVRMSTFRIALLAFFLGVVVLSLIFYNDATYTVTPRFSPRPPYPPFRPPPLNDPPPSPPPPPPHNDSHWPEHDTNAIALLWTSRATSVREAFLHAYRNYEKYAPFPADELLPLSNQSVLKSVDILTCW